MGSNSHSSTGQATTEQTRIVQWNCCTFSTKSAELRLRFERQPPPDVLLLQETRTPNLTFPCYSFYTNPTIVTTPRPSERNPETKKGWAAVAVLRHIPHAQLDTASLCNGNREVVAVRLSHKRKRMTLASVYIRPGTATEDDKEATAWIGELVGLAEGDPIVIAGDFNARHKDWGYSNSTRIGRRTRNENCGPYTSQRAGN